jgi:hypothetical protein
MRANTKTFSHTASEQQEEEKQQIGFSVAQQKQPRPTRPAETTPMNGQTITNAKGGKQSFTKAMFSAIPAISLKLLAECLGFGARKYGFDNWKNLSLEENICHALNHLNEWRLGDRSEPHLVNAMARISFALWHAVDQGEQPATYIHPDESNAK